MFKKRTKKDLVFVHSSHFQFDFMLWKFNYREKGNFSWSNELLNGSHPVNVTKMRVNKFNRTAPVYNIEFDLLIDADNDFEAESNYYYNRLNNNQYRKTLFRLPKGNMCFLLDRYYREVMNQKLRGHSNFPEREIHQRVCPIKKVISIEERTWCF